MQEISIRARQKVLNIDDLLADGGSLNAACELIEAAGRIVGEIIVLIEKTAANGRARIPVGKVHSFIAHNE